ncbi:branched-chain amino acid ABC transporter permease [Pseudooceanicola sp. 216_PA32_1]|uniref:Branched-chain amino acid ABC transporter permease n=1 Tax=Pseudooceanicola pacificus TaxID=2676438 RepID=A0A844W330_9RHOB|nr:branched-chain amino acid ABC transporter permease [Pseudooceanicola pacificus]MWB78197.1 branched-chain amino acid ABC transporter permease [Pseudooceanicola pacificus]
MSSLAGYEPLFELALLNMVLAFSQYIPLRAGVFSLGSAAFAAVGAYAAAILATRYGVPPVVCVVIAVVAGGIFGALAAVPLARLRGVFQALATLALVQIVLSTALNWTALTDGALGINSIPKAVHLTEAAIAVVFVGYVLHVIGLSAIGRGFDIIREDETVAVSLGYSVRKHHMIAFVLSGAIAGLGGAMHAFSSYSITPNEFGFHMVVMLLAMVVLGGRVSVFGPVVGAIILTGLPELLRGFQDYRSVVQGALLMASITFLPSGVVDTTRGWLRRRALTRGQAGADAAEVTS